eukprot:2370698-Rhodomonas_salina.1
MGIKPCQNGSRSEKPSSATVFSGRRVLTVLFLHLRRCRQVVGADHAAVPGGYPPGYHCQRHPQGRAPPRP